MKSTIRRLALLRPPVAVLPLLLCSGCITLPPSMFKNNLNYQPTRAPTSIDASVSVEATHTLTPEVRSLWKKWMNNDATIDNWQKAVADVEADDIAQSGLFARVQPAAGSRPDYQIKIDSVESRSESGESNLKVTLRVLDGNTGREMAAFMRSASIGKSISTYDMKGGLQRVMAELKDDVAAEIQKRSRQQSEATALAEAEALKNASLNDLLAGSDPSVVVATARNHALIAAKNQQLPDLLRDAKTDDLNALVVKIEQTILDLNHESEVLKDRAQQAAASPEVAQTSGRDRISPGAAAATPGSDLDELRGLTISYRERIELLKPIAAALREEIANRNR